MSAVNLSSLFLKNIHKNIIITNPSYGLFQISLKQQPAADAERSLQTSRHPHGFVSVPTLKSKQCLDIPGGLTLQSVTTEQWFAVVP